MEYHSTTPSLRLKKLDCLPNLNVCNWALHSFQSFNCHLVTRKNYFKTFSGQRLSPLRRICPFDFISLWIEYWYCLTPFTLVLRKLYAYGTKKVCSYHDINSWKSKNGKCVFIETPFPDSTIIDCEIHDASWMNQTRTESRSFGFLENESYPNEFEAEPDYRITKVCWQFCILWLQSSSKIKRELWRCSLHLCIRKNKAFVAKWSFS